MKTITFRGGLALLAAATIGLAAAPASAADYPTGPIRLIVGYTPGGASDIVTRTIAKGLTKELGQSVVVENRAGAASNIGTAYVANAAPDGYTLLLGTIAMSVNPSLYKDLPFNPLTDFAPVSQVASTPFMLVSTVQSGIKTVPDLIQAAKNAQPPLSYASAGVGSGANLFMEYFRTQTGIPLVHIPYKGTAPAMTDMLGGRVPLTFDNIMTTLPLVKQGKFNALAVSTKQPNSLAPEVPPLGKYVAGFEAQAWFGLFAPARTPRAIVDRLNAATVKALQDPEIRDALLQQGAEPVSSSPQQFGEFYRNEVAKWKKVVQQADIKME
jgi:tripartite-type tricarboxylate transporter receptor subunit TctC